VPGTGVAWQGLPVVEVLANEEGSP
jgi:hypothetical protein